MKGLLKDLRENRCSNDCRPVLQTGVVCGPVLQAGVVCGPVCKTGLRKWSIYFRAALKHWFSAAIVAVLVGGWVVGSIRGDEEISYLDRATKKEVKIHGTIKSETPTEIEIKPAIGAARKIPAIDVIDVVYDLPALIKGDYRTAANRETAGDRPGREEDRNKDLALAQKKYQELLPKLTEEKARRHIEFKVAKILARQAELDQTEVAGAIGALERFISANPQAWQLKNCIDLLARLDGVKGDWNSAQKVYEEWARRPDLTADMRQDAQLHIAQILVKAKKYAEAEKTIQTLVGEVDPTSLAGFRMQLALAECIAASGKVDEGAALLESLIAKTADPDLKARAYNALGDCHRQAQRPKDAIWAYLWVDVIYHQSRQEHAKALYYLAKLFKDLKDDARARQFRTRLENKQFAGLEYQQMLLSEK